MLWHEGLLTAFTTIFLFLLLISRDTFNSCILTGILYFLLLLFRFPPVPLSRAQLVLKPRGQVSVIAHRGGGHDAPENTLAAIKQAAQNGATGVELDLEFSADGVPILMHDDTVDRTTDGSGSLSEYTYSQLKRLNPAAKHRLRHLFHGERIPTLRQAVMECMHYNLTIFFDVKGHASEAVAALRKMYMEFPRLYNMSIVCSFEPQVIYLMRKSDINVVTGLTHRPWSFSHFGDGKPRFNSAWKHYLYMSLDVVMDWSLHNILWNLCGISAFLMQKSFISETYVRQWMSRGVEVVAWTVNDFSEKGYYQAVLQSCYMTDSLLETCSPHV
ncbi:glycerophosphodiester phosphodiesterase 1 [Ambystoma mexicanum]|uniref:glycerophosphodiester phosphodiesterase 1 n=1 Tax=Ambystoma mexicanum TaxID=8296 RepID=UPI0037E88088